ncbi:MAG: CBS and ACT domain-containing protein [Bacillota bacterium]
MLVKERMTKDPVCIEPHTSVLDALAVLKKHNVRRLPVCENGRLVGLVTQMDLLKASPSEATSLSVWELNYLISKTTVSDIMARRPVTVTPDMPVEEAALIMRDKRIGGLPVVESDKLVGIITETDIFDAFVDLAGVRRGGVRVTLMLEDKTGSLAHVAKMAEEHSVNILSVSTLPPLDGFGESVWRLSGERVEEFIQALKDRGIKVLHVA